MLSCRRYVKYIVPFKIATKTRGTEQKTFIRAGVALVYAHWEGFIKEASEIYLSYVDNQGHTYRDLKSCFAVFGLKGRLAILADSRKSQTNIEAFEFVLGEMDRITKMSMSTAIDTESNLTSKVFSNIASSLDISIAPYLTKFNLIDERLVQRRNKVAHGEYLDLAADDFLMLADEIIQMMRHYKADLQNAASLKAYRRPPGGSGKAGSSHIIGPTE